MRREPPCAVRAGCRWPSENVGSAFVQRVQRELCVRCRDEPFCHKRRECGPALDTAPRQITTWLLLQPNPRSAHWIHQDLRHAADGWVRGGRLGRHLILSSPASGAGNCYVPGESHSALVPGLQLKPLRGLPRHQALLHRAPIVSCPISSAVSTICRYRRSMSRDCDRSMRSAAISNIAAPSSSRGAPELAAGQVSGHCSSRQAASQNIHS